MPLVETALYDTFVGAGVVSILLALVKINWDIHSKMDMMKKERDDKIGRIYGRFDEYKASFERKHVAKDMCQVLHSQIIKDLNEVKIDLKELLKRREADH